MSEQVLIAVKLKNAREYVGLSILSVSRYLNMSIEEIHKIENGSLGITKRQLEDFARLYKHNITFFYGEIEDSEPIQLLARTIDNLTDRDREQITRFSRILIEVGKER